MLAVAVLAAGKGTRMKSDLPKVLQPLAGATLVERVLASCNGLAPERQILIVGHQAERVEQSLAHRPGLEFVLQQPQNGTGHAVQQLLAPLANFEGELLVLNGDVPLLREQTIANLLERHRSSGAAVTLLTARLSDPTGYGRVFADSEGQVSAIVEHRDCSEAQRTNNLINAGIYCFNWKQLAAVLPTLNTNNDQGELYLTDTEAMLSPAMHVEVADADEINGINDRYQLSQCEAVIQERLRRHWMAEGVTFVDPASCTLSDGTRFGSDVVVEPQCHFRGNSVIGNGCRIGPSSLIDEARIGDGVEIVYSVVREAVVASGCAIGPFAQLRPGAELGESCRVGELRGDQKEQPGGRLQGESPQLHRRCRAGRGCECGRRHDHRQLRRREQAPHRNRCRQQNRCQQRAGRTDHPGSQRDRGRRLHPHQGCGEWGPRPGPRQAAGEGKLAAAELS